jgi:TusA-related sulfurtransferase
MLDLTGTKCPITLLRARTAIQKLNTGERLVIKANADFRTDIMSYCRKAGHGLSIVDDQYFVTKG